MTVTVSLSSKVAINSASCWCLLEYTLHRQVRSRQLPVDTTAAAATTVKSSHNLMPLCLPGVGTRQGGKGPPQSPALLAKKIGLEKMSGRSFGSGPQRRLLDRSMYSKLGKPKKSLPGICPCRLLWLRSKIRRLAGSVDGMGPESRLLLDALKWSKSDRKPCCNGPGQSVVGDIEIGQVGKTCEKLSLHATTQIARPKIQDLEVGQ